MDTQFDGGGWMVVANHRGGVVMTNGHQPRLTANSSQVGSFPGNPNTESSSFSVNCGSFPISEVIHYAYNNNNFTQPVAHYYQSFTPSIQLPTTSNTYKFNNTGGGDEVPGFADRLFHASTNDNTYDQFRAGGIFLGTPGSGGGDTSGVYPVWISYWNVSNEFKTFSFTDTVNSGSTGWDDYQDGSGMGDQWSVENVGGNAYRDFPNCVVIR